MVPADSSELTAVKIAAVHAEASDANADCAGLDTAWEAGMAADESRLTNPSLAAAAAGSVSWLGRGSNSAIENAFCSEFPDRSGP